MSNNKGANSKYLCGKKFASYANPSPPSKVNIVFHIEKYTRAVNKVIFFVSMYLGVLCLHNTYIQYIMKSMRIGYICVIPKITRNQSTKGQFVHAC